MRLPNSAHTSRPWRIHEIAPDFKLEDVWELPGRAAPGDFPSLVQLITSLDLSQSPSRVTRALWDIRWKVGGLLGWDDPDGGLNSRVPTLRDRLPADLVRHGHGPEFASIPLTPLYLSDDEFAAEIANKTMHGVMHIGAVQAQDERALRGCLHGRDQALPPSDHLSGGDATGAGTVGEHRRHKR